jgi:23S rRNA (cytidine1920-2'-O)/16S rRNA (cytidine1409-2'-O)-methyltransferase
VTVRRRLDAELVRRGLIESPARAADVIAQGRVLVGGSLALEPTRMVGAGEPIHVTGDARRFVSRGGEKLAAALDHFAIDVRNRRALDAGAAAGGFTDCLLQAGAAEVVAVDVGRGQLAWELRNDARVTLFERTNVRGLDAGAIAGAVSVVAADLSFISLVTVAPAFVRCSTDDVDLVLLVKPQFEAGRARVGEGGVVRDPNVHRAVLREVRDGLAASHLVVLAAITSPLRGADGNVEFLFHCRKADSVPERGSGDPADAVSESALDACVDDALERPGARR